MVGDWDMDLALAYLSKGSIGAFSIKKKRGRRERVEVHDRKRQNGLRGKWPILEKQLKWVGSQLQHEFDPARAGSSPLSPSVLSKMATTIRMLMAFCVNRQLDERLEVRLEVLLCGRHIQSWITYCLVTRGVVYSTMSTYLTSLVQAVECIKAKVWYCSTLTALHCSLLIPRSEAYSCPVSGAKLECITDDGQAAPRHSDNQEASSQESSTAKTAQHHEGKHECPTTDGRQ